MIILERVIDPSFPNEVWTDDVNRHVMVCELENTFRYGSGGPGWYIRDEVGEVGPYLSFDEALEMASSRWGAVALGPALRLEKDLAQARVDEGMQFLVEHLAEYGAVGIDVKALAEQVLTRIEEEG